MEHLHLVKLTLALLQTNNVTPGPLKLSALPFQRRKERNLGAFVVVINFSSLSGDKLRQQRSHRPVRSALQRC